MKMEKMRPVEAVPGMRGGREGWRGEFNYDTV
jgi:hypothetical protein